MCCDNILKNLLCILTIIYLTTRAFFMCCDHLIMVTDVAKSVGAPVFHVNGDDPEAVCACIRTAVDFRQKFERDAVVDIVCYRRHGHNEQDNPEITQPQMVRA